MRAPVPYTVVRKWVEQTKSTSPTLVDRMVDRHLVELCNRETFGLWAHTFSKLPANVVEPFVATAIRVGYLGTPWKQAVIGIFAALGFETMPRLPNGVWSAGAMTPAVITAIADAVLKARPDERQIKRWRRALTMLTRTGMASVIDDGRKQLAEDRRSTVRAAVATTAPF